MRERSCRSAPSFGENSVHSPSTCSAVTTSSRGTALSNALVGLELGIRDFDCSLGGIGGCPYAPGAAGNLATEDLVYTLHGMGVDTGVHLPALIEASHVAQKLLGRPLPGRVHQAGLPVPRT